MQVVFEKELVMDNSHSFSLAELPISTGEKFTIIVMKNTKNAELQTTRRKAYVHRFTVDNLELPSREDLYER